MTPVFRLVKKGIRYIRHFIVYYIYSNSNVTKKLKKKTYFIVKFRLSISRRRCHILSNSEEIELHLFPQFLL